MPAVTLGLPAGARILHSIMALPESDTDQLATVLQAQWEQIGMSVQIVSTSNYVTDLHQDHKAAMGLNPSGLPGIES